MDTDLNEDDIIQMLKIMNESTFDELRLETDDLKLVFSKNRNASTIQDSLKANLMQLPKAATNSAPTGENVSLAGNKKDSAAVKLAAPEEEGLVPVKAPVLGIFYRAPSPGAPPFVEEGTFVKENDTVCIIEVMKVFYSVSAGVPGVVVKFCAENGQMVEFGLTLLLIRPDGVQEGKSEACG